VYRWELDDSAQPAFDELGTAAQALLTSFMDAVVIVDPIDYQRHPGERSDPPAPLRTLHFGRHHEGLVTFLVYPRMSLCSLSGFNGWATERNATRSSCRRPPANARRHTTGAPPVLLLPRRSPAFHLDMPYSAARKPVPRETTQSSLLAEQVGHRLLVGDCARPAGGHPLPMCRQRCLDLGLLEEVRWGMLLYRLEPPQVRKRDDRGGFAAQMDDLVGARVTRR
jgi:hypothetical protein